MRYSRDLMQGQQNILKCDVRINWIFLILHFIWPHFYAYIQREYMYALCTLRFLAAKLKVAKKKQCVNGNAQIIGTTVYYSDCTPVTDGIWKYEEMEIQIQYMHDIKCPLDLGKSVSVK